jgi:hypothetical protein
MKSLILASIVLAVTSSATFAATPLINARQHAQSNRIAQGVVSGELTPGEQARLLNGQNHVQNLKTMAKADGVVTLGERLRINTAQSVQGARIFWHKHN